MPSGMALSLPPVASSSLLDLVQLLPLLLSAVAMSACCIPCSLQLLCPPCFVATRRRSRPDYSKVPASPQFTVQWLDGALRNSGLLPEGVNVSGLRHAEISITVDDGADDVINGGGLAGGRTVRIREIDYSGPASSTLPRSMIQKWCNDVDVVGGSADHPDSLGERIVLDYVIGLRMAKDKAMVNEIHFYRDLAPGVVAATGLRLPTVYYSGIDGDADTNCCLYTWRRDSVFCRTTLLLEDLSVSGYQDCGHVVLGWRQRVPLPVCEVALAAMAKLHAWGWGGRQMPKSNWTALLCGCSWAQHNFVINKWCKNNHLQRYIDLWADHPQREWLGDVEVIAMLWDLRASLPRWFPRAKALSRTQTTIHGDFHRGNLFYTRTKFVKGVLRTNLRTSDIALIDWAMLGAGHCAWELVYFMMTTLDRTGNDVAGLLAEEDRLLALYHSELAESNPDAGRSYTLDQLRRDVKLVWACHLVAGLDEQGTADSRATDVIARRGPANKSQPTVQGFGNLSIKAESAHLVDHSMRVLIQRFVLLRQRGDQDLFDGGVHTPVRPTAEISASRLKAQSDYAKKTRKKEREGLRAPWEAFHLPWERTRVKQVTKGSNPRFVAHIPELEEPEELVSPCYPAMTEVESEPEPASANSDSPAMTEVESEPEPASANSDSPAMTEVESEPEPASANSDRVREMLGYVGTSNVTLHMAVEKQIFEVTKQILDLDPAQMKKHNEQALVPFFAAGMTGKTELLPVIHEAAIRHFGPVDGPMYTTHWRWTKQGAVTLLHHAALNDFEEVTEWLCAHGADLDAWSHSATPTQPPFTPLMMACKYNCTRAACALVNAGADVNVRVPDGKGGGDLTPLHIAIQLNNTDLAAFLFSKGARNSCMFGCTKCRMHSKWMARRLITMRENIQARLAAEEREAARKREMEEVMKELSFVDFLSEMKKIAGGVDSGPSQEPDDARIEDELAGAGGASDPQGRPASSATQQQVRKRAGKKKQKKGVRK